MALSLTGNDVVDLGDPMNARAHERARFVARVCGDRERAAIRRSSDPAALLWSFFAAKEAAFKLVCKLGSRPVFAHRSFVIDPSLASVRHAGRTFPLWLERQGDRLHVVTWTGSERPLACAAEVDPSTDLGVAARSLVAAALAQRLCCSPAMLTVARDPEPEAWDNLGPPQLLRCGVPVAGDVSLSHDGRFVAFAAALQGDVRAFA